MNIGRPYFTEKGTERATNYCAHFNMSSYLHIDRFVADSCLF